MTGFLKQAARFAAIGTLVVGATVVPATAAQAKPARCSGSWNAGKYTVRCFGGFGSYRAYVDCYRAGHTTYTPRKGPWIPVQILGASSSVRCLDSEDPGTSFAQLRDI